MAGAVTVAVDTSSLAYSGLQQVIQMCMSHVRILYIYITMHPFLNLGTVDTCPYDADELMQQWLPPKEEPMEIPDSPEGLPAPADQTKKPPQPSQMPAPASLPRKALKKELTDCVTAGISLLQPGANASSMAKRAAEYLMEDNICGMCMHANMYTLLLFYVCLSSGAGCPFEGEARCTGCYNGRGSPLS